MKIHVKLKDPDIFDECIDMAFANFAVAGITDRDELAALKQVRRDKAAAAVHKWTEYGEYINIEFDTEAGTAIVLPADK